MTRDVIICLNYNLDHIMLTLQNELWTASSHSAAAASAQGRACL